ncbi:MAG TPA: AtpZ/AtpI family protein [Bacteroidales bacterium]|nr:AtpZ/AtpI family protein [Bacteroidales bacterium]HRS17946.1 AtpZ/AtpI family protein [Bacteroidales bacterium]
MRKNLNYKNALAYTNIGFQMLAIILIGVFGGQKLDDYFELHNSLCTIICSLLSVFASIYLAIKDIIHMNKE